VTKVIFDISMSLDGFVTASNVRPEEPMGDGGQRLHEWAFGEDERNRELLTESMNFVGAIVAGRRTYDISVGWWGADGPAGDARVPGFFFPPA
jgi:dihydrofolate reductase